MCDSTKHNGLITIAFKIIKSYHLVHVEDSQLVGHIGQSSDDIVPINQRRRQIDGQTFERFLEALDREVEWLFDVCRKFDEPITSLGFNMTLDSVDDIALSLRFRCVVLVDVANDIGWPGLKYTRPVWTGFMTAICISWKVSNFESWLKWYRIQLWLNVQWSTKLLKWIERVEVKLFYFLRLLMFLNPR